MTATIPGTTGFSGQMLIAGTPVPGTGKEVRAFDPAVGTALDVGGDRLQEAGALLGGGGPVGGERVGGRGAGGVDVRGVAVAIRR
ncbi:hypothetical protein ASJ79_20560, partial [Mycobacterium sp. NAZ190054]